MSKIFTDPRYTQKHPVRPHGTVGLKDSDSLLISGNLRLYEVKPAARIMKVALQAGGEEGIEELRTGGNVEAYFLPYFPDRAYRTTLDTGGRTNVDPAFCFTVELNGCTVVVDGPPATPNVYHLNAQSIGGALDLEMIPASQNMLTQRVNAKVANMEQRYKDARKDHPTSATSGGSGRAVDMTHYLKPQINVAAYNTLMDKLQRDLKLDANAPAIDYVTPALPMVEFYATAFGIRDGRTKFWSFYVNSRIRYKTWVKQRGTDGSSVDHWSESEAKHRSLGCEQFYPTGIGKNL